MTTQAQALKFLSMVQQALIMTTQEAVELLVILLGRLVNRAEQ